MEPPCKRPRLSIFQVPPANSELERARYRNDLSLKSRFEAIFQKYSHDFTDIGDEIDITTGEVVVNNGHLESMVNETDIGEKAACHTSQPSGRSLLRAMTVIPNTEDQNRDNSISDEVMLSIETMAENAAVLTDDHSSVSSSDELFDPPFINGSSATSRAQPSLPSRPITPYLVESSDDDSLFRLEGARYSSPDSLFESDETYHAIGWEQESQSSKFKSIDSGTQVDLSDEAILDRLGHSLGHEVLEILEKRKPPHEAHLEPAWRIPVDIGPTNSPNVDCSPVPRARKASPNATISLWHHHQPRQSRCRGRPRKREPKPLQRKVRGASMLRGESLDPLQADCNGELTLTRNKNQALLEMDDGETIINGDSEANESDSAPRYDKHPTKKRRLRNLDTGSNSDSDYGCNPAVNRMAEQSHSKEFAITRDESEAWESEDLSTTRSGSGSDFELEEGETPIPEEQGLCSFCQQQFSCKSAVMAHWDRLLKKKPSKIAENDPHDLVAIGILRRNKMICTRCPRLLLEDFRTMVELHEGAGMTFEEIVESRALRTHKTAARLRDLYDRHRGISRESRKNLSSWTSEEDRLLDDLCKNSLVTMATLRRHLKGRDVFDIGNRLANKWLHRLQIAERPKQEHEMDYGLSIGEMAGAEFGSNTGRQLSVSIKYEEE